MIIREEYLVIINSKNRVQRVKLQIEKDPIKTLYTIHRVTGQYGGKETSQPDLIITEGKVKRTASEQASPLVFETSVISFSSFSISLSNLL